MYSEFPEFLQGKTLHCTHCTHLALREEDYVQKISHNGGHHESQSLMVQSTGLLGSNYS